MLTRALMLTVITGTMKAHSRFMEGTSIMLPWRVAISVATRELSERALVDEINNAEEDRAAAPEGAGGLRSGLRALLAQLRTTPEIEFFEQPECAGDALRIADYAAKIDHPLCLAALTKRLDGSLGASR